MRARKRLGDMLVEDGLLSEVELIEVLKEQSVSNYKLGEYLVVNDIVSESDIIEMLSRQLRVDRYFPNDYQIDVALSAAFPAELATRFKAAPVKAMDNSLVVAMTDPLDINAIDLIEEASSKILIPVICSSLELEQLIGAVYGIASELEDAILHLGSDNSRLEVSTIKEEQPALQISSLQDMAEGAPVVLMVNWIISEAVKQKASDIHISPEKKSVSVRLRIDGKLQEIPAPPKQLNLAIISRLKILANMDIAISMVPQDGRFTVMVGDREVNIRASVLPTTNGENIVLRLLDMSASIFSLDQLGMNQADLLLIERVIKHPHGMILSTGPTGSGKSTSLYAILQKVYTPQLNIITVEDPVEYRVDKIRQVQLNHKAGMTFASALRSILRQDPDIIMIGEIRDTETAVIAVRSALTGHQVLSTVHTNDAAGAIGRLVDMGIPPFLVSNTLLCAFAQRLVRKICPHCKEVWTPNAEVLAEWELDTQNPVQLTRGKGCMHCMQTGYKGRTAVFEVLVVNDLVKELISNVSSSQQIVNAAVKAGHLRTLKEDVKEKMLQGVTSLEEAEVTVMV